MQPSLSTRSTSSTSKPSVPSRKAKDLIEIAIVGKWHRDCLELQRALEYGDSKLKRYVNFVFIQTPTDVRGRQPKYYTFAKDIDCEAVAMLQQRGAVYVDVQYTVKGPVLMDSGKQLLT